MKNENLTQQYIFEAYYLLLKQKAYDKISVCEICKLAGYLECLFIEVSLLKKI